MPRLLDRNQPLRFAAPQGGGVPTARGSQAGTLRWQDTECLRQRFLALVAPGSQPRSPERGDVRNLLRTHEAAGRFAHFFGAMRMCKGAAQVL